MIISYSQNFEDIMLWRAFSHIKNGFYIDVGAGDPNEHSVTKLFYESNWHGINIEPVPASWERLNKIRSRDINLNLAIASNKGKSILYEVMSNGLFGLSTLDQSIANYHEQQGLQVNEREIETIPLQEICEKYINHDIHFLKIDVEGLERSVLESMNFSQFRPQIILIESTFPNSKKETYEKWEFLLLKNNYLFAYFDGLNRFYVAKENSNLLQHFTTPPNVFDDFIHHKFILLQTQLKETHINFRMHQQKIDNYIAKLEKKADSLSRDLYERNSQLAAIYSSRSWKITFPFRYVKNKIHKFSNDLLNLFT